MNDEEWEDIVNKCLVLGNQAFKEFVMEVPRDTICYIKPVYAESIDFTIDLKRKRKRCINI